MRDLMRAALASGVLLVGLTGQAQAATTIGEATGSGALICTGDFTYVQGGTASSSPSYGVPVGGGVITSWSHTVSTDTPSTATMRLKVFTNTGTQSYLTVGHSDVEKLASPGLKNFATRISVQAGDLLGLRPGSAATDCYRPSGQSGDFTETGAFLASDPPVGSKFNSVSTVDESLLNIAAVVEPDADHDDFGDETQDQCPVDASTQGSCPDADADGVPDATDQCPSQVGPASSNGCPAANDDCAKAKKKLAKAKKKLKKLKQNDAGDETIAKAKGKVKKAKKRKKEACA